MFDLDYAQPLTFTSADMQDFSPGSVITYVCSTIRSKEWSDIGRDLYNKVNKKENEENGAYPKEAIKLLGLCLISIEQNGTIYDIGNEAKAKELRNTIENFSTGTGDQYITDLAETVYIRVMTRTLERKKKSSNAEKD